MAKKKLVCGEIFGVLGTIVPLMWFGGLLVYFLVFNKNTDGLFAGQLGSTILGLGAVIILMVFSLFIRFARGLSAGAVDKSGAMREADAPSDFDADAALERHLARRAQQTGQHTPGQQSADVILTQAAQTPRPSFGRKQH